MREARNLELDLRFPDPSHLVITLDSESAGPLDFAARITPKEREELRWYLETYAAHYTTDVDDAEARRIEARLREWGTALFRAVFQDRAAERLFSRFQSTTGRNLLLNVRADHPAILSLPWELLRDPGGTYVFDREPRISIRRRVTETVAGRAVARSATQRLRVLFVTSRPSDAPFIDPRTESQAVMDAIDRHGAGRIEIEFLRPATFRKLAERLADKSLPAVDIVHFDGHGAYDTEGSFGDKTPDTGYLLFERDSGLTHFISPSLWHELAPDGEIRLVILSACQSAAMGDSGIPDRVAEPIGSVAYGLAALHVPAVLAMTHSLLVDTAHQLFGEFYRHLSEGRGIGVALDNARHHILRNPEKHEVQRGSLRLRLSVQDWFLPALYQAGQDVTLLDSGVEAAPAGSVNVATKKTESASAAIEIPLTARLPEPHRAGFFGRRRELWEIERAFVAGTRRLSISGFGGQGKTYLAAEAGRWLLRTRMFERIVFVSYAAFQGVDASGYAIATMGAALGQSLPDTVAAEAALRTIPTLIILDNLESLPAEPLNELLSTAATWSECGGTRLLLTSRLPDYPHHAYRDTDTAGHVSLPLKGLAEEDALSYFQSLMKLPPTPTTASPNRDALLQLFRRVSFHPLSIHLLAVQLKTRGVEELDAHLESLLADGSDDTTQSLRASLQLSLDRLDVKTRESLPALGVFRGGAWESALLAVTKIPEPQWAALRVQLAAAALIEVESLVAEGIGVPYVRFHPTLAPLLWSQLPASEQTALSAEHCRHYSDLSKGLLALDSERPLQMRAIVRRELPNLHAAAEGALTAKEPFAETFAGTVATFLRLSGFERDAAALTGRAMRTVSAGSETGLLLRIAQGEQLWERGQPHEAQAVFREVLAELTDEPTLTRCRALTGLGQSYRTLSRPDLAERAYREALAIVDRLQPADDVRSRQGALQLELGNALSDMGRHAEARGAYDVALAVATELRDMRSVGVVNAHLGALALAQHDLPTAARRYREAIALFRQLGEPAPEAIYRHQLGIVLQEAGEHGEAEKEYRESARIAEARGDAIGAAHTWLQLGLLSESAGKHQAAEDWYHKALQGYRSGGDTAGLSRTSGNLAALLYEQPGRLAEARKLAEDALALKLTLGPGARQIWTTYNLLAEIADKENEPTRAQEYRRHGRTAYRNYPGSREDVNRYARLVAAVVASARGDRAAQQAVAREQRTMRQSGADWTRLALVIDQVLAGQRDLEALTANLNALPSLVAEAILEAIKQAYNRDVEPGFAGMRRRPMDSKVGGPVDLEQLASLVEQFVGTRTPADARRMLEQHPQLLGDDVAFVLERVLEGARGEGNAPAVHALQQRRALLQRCREIGVDAAFRELKA